MIEKKYETEKISVRIPIDFSSKTVLCKDISRITLFVDRNRFYQAYISIQQILRSPALIVFFGYKTRYYSCFPAVYHSLYHEHRLSIIGYLMFAVELDDLAFLSSIQVKVFNARMDIFSDILINTHK